jgi:large subunit ribosomal protein L20
MSRVKRGTIRAKKRAQLLKLVKGFKHGRKNLVKQAKQAMLRAGQHAYRDRRRKKREFRALWIIRLNAAVRQHDLTYKTFIFGLKKAKLDLNRKVLSELALREPKEFEKVTEKVKKALAMKT